MKHGRPIEPMQGQHGDLTVFAVAGKRNGMADWLCRCSCGVSLIIRGAAIRAGVRSCRRCASKRGQKTRKETWLRGQFRRAS